MIEAILRHAGKAKEAHMTRSVLGTHLTGLGLLLAAALAASGFPLRGEETKAKPGSGKVVTWTFDDEKPDALPKGFRKEVGEWKVAPAGAGEKGNVLAQTAKSSGPTFNVALVEAESRR